MLFFEIQLSCRRVIYRHWSVEKYGKQAWLQGLLILRAGKRSDEPVHCKRFFVLSVFLTGEKNFHFYYFEFSMVKLNFTDKNSNILQFLVNLNQFELVGPTLLELEPRFALQLTARKQIGFISWNAFIFKRRIAFVLLSWIRWHQWFNLASKREHLSEKHRSRHIYHNLNNVIDFFFYAHERNHDGSSTIAARWRVVFSIQSYEGTCVLQKFSSVEWCLKLTIKWHIAMQLINATPYNYQPPWKWNNQQRSIM
jgi:hypothetical protein